MRVGGRVGESGRAKSRRGREGGELSGSCAARVSVGLDCG